MAKVAIKNLLLARSGQTEWDAAGRVQGSTDLPLSPGGLAMVQAEASTLLGREIATVLTAPDEASRETARLIAEASGGKVVVVPELAEPALGLWEGMRAEDLEKRFCRAGRVFFDDPCGVVAPEGDSLGETAERVLKAFGKGMGKCKVGGSIALVVRPIALGIIRCALNEVDLGELWSMTQDRPALEWYTIQRNDPRLIKPPRRVRAAA
jgi:broad specificity phosphatase PhoE